MGSNGTGKSTGLKILAGKQKPNLGKYAVSLSRLSRHQCFFFFFMAAAVI